MHHRWRKMQTPAPATTTVTNSPIGGWKNGEMGRRGRQKARGWGVGVGGSWKIRETKGGCGIEGGKCVETGGNLVPEGW